MQGFERRARAQQWVNDDGDERVRFQPPGTPYEYRLTVAYKANAPVLRGAEQSASRKPRPFTYRYDKVLMPDVGVRQVLRASEVPINVLEELWLRYAQQGLAKNEAAATAKRGDGDVEMEQSTGPDFLNNRNLQELATLASFMLPSAVQEVLCRSSRRLLGRVCENPYFWQSYILLRDNGNEENTLDVAYNLYENLLYKIAAWMFPVFYDIFQYKAGVWKGEFSFDARTIEYYKRAMLEMDARTRDLAFSVMLSKRLLVLEEAVYLASEIERATGGQTLRYRIYWRDRRNKQKVLFEMYKFWPLINNASTIDDVIGDKSYMHGPTRVLLHTVLDTPQKEDVWNKRLRLVEQWARDFTADGAGDLLTEKDLITLRAYVASTAVQVYMGDPLQGYSHTYISFNNGGELVHVNRPRTFEFQPVEETQRIYEQTRQQMRRQMENERFIDFFRKVEDDDNDRVSPKEAKKIRRMETNVALIANASDEHAPTAATKSK